jgi:Fe-S oxidoreductase
MLMQMNIETLNGYGVKKIVTACPHCFNTLKNEYPQFGGNYEVYHHSEYIKMLIEQGRLKLKNVIRDKETITYHDSCYLSRYNELIDEPRFILKAANFDLKEMKRNKDRGFCCGAGGGRMFLEEKEGERVNVNRTKEALETNANIIASACPFCMTMLEDGLKTLDKLDKVQVKDITEIVLEKI